MTKEQAIKFLSNTKVYVKDKSEEIQEKLFSLGIYWDNDTKEVFREDAPFLYIGNHKGVSTITYGSSVDYFYGHEYDEITVDDILNINITEPTYRPFKDEPYRDINVEFTNLSAIWHNTSEEPKFNEEIIIADRYNVVWFTDISIVNERCKNWESYVQDFDVKNWAYVADIVPKGGGL